MEGQKLQAVAFKAEPIRISWPDAADILCHFATTGKFLFIEASITDCQRVTCLSVMLLTEVGSSET